MRYNNISQKGKYQVKAEDVLADKHKSAKTASEEIADKNGRNFYPSVFKEMGIINGKFNEIDNKVKNFYSNGKFYTGPDI